MANLRFHSPDITHDPSRIDGRAMVPAVGEL